MGTPAKKNQTVRQPSAPATSYVVRSGKDGTLERVILTDEERKARAKFLRYASLSSDGGQTSVPRKQIHAAVAKYFEEAERRLAGE